MAERYTLAVWTSTKPQNAKNIIQHLFISNNIPLLFQWYNANCKRINRYNYVYMDIFVYVYLYMYVYIYNILVCKYTYIHIYIYTVIISMV
jgi:hypothetical protein